MRLSEDYKKAELEVVAARSEPGEIIEERRTEIITVPRPPPPPGPYMPGPPPPPPQQQWMPPPPAPVEVVQERIIRDVSPARSSRSYSTSTTSRTPLIVETRPRESSGNIPVGPLALVTSDRRRDEKAIKNEIARLEAERDLIRHERHHHSHSRSRSQGGELVRAERLSTGELVLFEEKVEKIEEPRRGVRIEKDKKGKMSISVPKYR